LTLRSTLTNAASSIHSKSCSEAFPISSSWLEVSLTVEAEIAEAIADFLSRFSPSGVAIEINTDDSADSLEPQIATVRAYIPADEDLPDIRSQIEEGLWHLGQITPLPEPQFQLVHQEDWESKWREHYAPIPIGDRLVVVPAWMPSPEPARQPIIIEPGMAFGTGLHATTQLCIGALEKHLQPGDSVLDIGAGSSILSIAAVRLGAGRVLAVEKDEDAVRVARNNIRLNGLQGQIEIQEGSGRDYLAQTSVPPVELLVSNIVMNVLNDLLEKGLHECVVPGGTLIFSGIMDHQCDEFVERGGSVGLQLLEITAESHWRAIIFQK
jgi:ribosomal protein L11 methyltransferase